MTDGGRMKGVEGGGGGAGEGEEREEEAREELELALSLGRRGWHLPPVRQEPAPPPALWTMVFPVWDPDEAGSSRAAERVWASPPVPPLRLRDMWRGGRCDSDTGRAVDVAEEEDEEEGDEDGDRDLQSKRPKVRGFGEESPQNSGVNAAFFGFKSPHLHASEEHEHFEMSRCPEHELDFGLSLFPNDGGNEIPWDANNERVGDVEKSGGRDSEDVEIRMDLCDDLLHLIFSFLDQKDICRAGATCKQWRSASMHEDSWRCLKFENTRISPQNFVDICHRYQNVTDLNLSGVMNAEILVMDAIMFLRHLKTLTMGGQLGEAFFLALAECPLLTTLTISDASLGSGIQEVTVNHDGFIITSNALQKLVLQKQESLSSLSLQCPNLIDVDLSDCESLTNAICEVFSDGGGCPMLRSLILDNCESLSIVELNSSSLVNLSLAGCRSMTFLKLSCPNLQKVNLDGCDHLERASFCLVGLESLNLGSCPKLSGLHIEAPKMSILELKGCGVLSQASINCPHLTSLDASFCRQLMDDSLSRTAEACPLIEHLILSSCVSIDINGLSSLHCLHKLTLLDLSYTFLINLKPVFDSCPQLKVLKLSACKYLSDSSLDALNRDGALPMLVELDLSYSSIGQTAIEELLACCTNLVNVNLNGCTNLHELVISDRSDHLLEVLNCTGCPNIKKVAIPSMANYLHLSKINLNLSTNLKEVDLTCSNLYTLNLSNCSSLEVLKLDCPRLTNLQLLACTMLQEEELESAISLCSALEILNVHSCPKINALDFGRLRVVCPTLKRIQSSLIA